MSDREGKVRRIIARVRCMLPKDWLGRAGKRFRQTTTVISDFSEEHIRPHEKLEEAPDLAWKALSGLAQEKYASALKSYSEEEKNKLESELKRRTLESNARTAKAEADKKESEARVAQITEMDARLALFDKLKARNAIPNLGRSGQHDISQGPEGFRLGRLAGSISSDGRTAEDT